MIGNERIIIRVIDDNHVPYENTCMLSFEFSYATVGSKSLFKNMLINSTLNIINSKSAK